MIHLCMNHKEAIKEFTVWMVNRNSRQLGEYLVYSLAHSIHFYSLLGKRLVVKSLTSPQHIEGKNLSFGQKPRHVPDSPSPRVPFPCRTPKNTPVFKIPTSSSKASALLISRKRWRNGRARRAPRVAFIPIIPSSLVSLSFRDWNLRNVSLEVCCLNLPVSSIDTSFLGRILIYTRNGLRPFVRMASLPFSRHSPLILHCRESLIKCFKCFFFSDSQSCCVSLCKNGFVFSVSWCHFRECFAYVSAMIWLFFLFRLGVYGYNAELEKELFMFVNEMRRQLPRRSLKLLYSKTVMYSLPNGTVLPYQYSIETSFLKKLTKTMDYHSLVQCPQFSYTSSRPSPSADFLQESNVSLNSCYRASPCFCHSQKTPMRFGSADQALVSTCGARETPYHRSFHSMAPKRKVQFKCFSKSCDISQQSRQAEWSDTNLSSVNYSFQQISFKGTKSHENLLRQENYNEGSNTGFKNNNSGFSFSGGGDGGGGGQGNDNNFNVSGRIQSPMPSEDQAIVVEFPVKHFWKIAKQQNDIESSEMGRCRGFYYRLLIHPKGTAGTDSEASHLSVFLEAVRQDWFPDDWVFPNVRFELTVVNFRDPKQSVSSWAHWSFSNDAASRGWQKMLSHSRLNRVSGFVDDEGTVLIRGKAEPPYGMLWSQTACYKSKHLFSLLPSPSSPSPSPPNINNCNNNNPLTSHGNSSVSSKFASQMSGSTQREGKSATFTPSNREGCTIPLQLTESSSCDQAIQRAFLPWRDTPLILQLCDEVVPALRVVLHADYLAYFVLILFFIREFRREIFIWNSWEKDDPDTNKHIDTTSKDGLSQTFPMIEALQSVFASLQLYPLVEAVTQLKSSNFKHQDVPEAESFIERWRHHLASAAACSDSTGSSGLESRCRQPSAKNVMCALCLSDLQKMDIPDPLPYIHTTLFTMIHRQCQIGYVGHIYKEAILDSQKQNDTTQSLEGDLLNESNLNVEQFDETCDAQELDHTLHLLFSTVSSVSLRDPLCLGDYATSFVKVKHVHSMYRALEQSGRKFKRLPGVLFIYLTSQRNTKKGELFDVPLRLEMSHFLELPDNPTASRSTMFSKSSVNGSHNRCSQVSRSGANSAKVYPERSAEGVILGGGCKEEKIKTKITRQKQRRRLRKQKTLERTSSASPLTDAQHHIAQDDISDEHVLSSHPSLDQETAAVATVQSADRWYCLYALIIREGDGPFGPGGVSQTSRTLLLRPEEDSPWYRITQNRVEKLVSKVEFTEWKCHRDFFCSAAVYIAEDYIDAISNGDVDLEGNLRDLNSSLYHKTLNEFGITESEIQDILKKSYEESQNVSSSEPSVNAEAPGLPDCQTPVHQDTSATQQEAEKIYPSIVNSNHYTNPVPSQMSSETCTRTDDVKEPVLKFSPIAKKNEKDESLRVDIPSSVHPPKESFLEKPNYAGETALLNASNRLNTTSFGSSSFSRQHDSDCNTLLHFKSIRKESRHWKACSSTCLCFTDDSELDSIAPCCVSLTNFSRLLHFSTHSSWSLCLEELDVFYFLHHRRLTHVIQRRQKEEIQRTLLEFLAECLILSAYVNVMLSSSASKHHSDIHEIRQPKVSMNWKRSLQFDKKTALTEMRKQPFAKKCELELSSCCPDNIFRECHKNCKRRRSMSECVLSKSYGEWTAGQLASLLREALQPCLSKFVDQILSFMNDKAGRFSRHQENVSLPYLEPTARSVLKPNHYGINSHPYRRSTDILVNCLWSQALDLLQKAQSCAKSAPLFSSKSYSLLDMNFSLHVPFGPFSSRSLVRNTQDMKPYFGHTKYRMNSFYGLKPNWINNSYHVSGPSLQDDSIKQSLFNLNFTSNSANVMNPKSSAPSSSSFPLQSRCSFSEIDSKENTLFFFSNLLCSVVVCAAESSSDLECTCVMHHPLSSFCFSPNLHKKTSTPAYLAYQNEMISQGQTKRQRSKMEDYESVNFPVTFSKAIDSGEPSDTVILKPKILSTRLKSKQSPVEDVWKQGHQYYQPNSTSEIPVANTTSNDTLMNKYSLSNVEIHQQLAYLLDPEDFMVPASAKEFYQNRLVNFGTVMRSASPLIPYLRNPSLAALNTQDASSFKNLRSLDSLLDGVGLSAGVKQLVTAVRYVRISINLEQDLFGLEGFGCEQYPPVSRVLTGYRGMLTGRLYGLLRLLLLRGDRQESFTDKPHGTVNDVQRQDREDFGHAFTRLKLQTMWKGTPNDSFMLYALVQDLDPSRRGRYRYVYMLADEIIDTYCDSKRRHVDPHAPDLIVLLVMCNHLDFELSSSPNGTTQRQKPKTRSTTTGTRQNATGGGGAAAKVERAGKQFPLLNDTNYPLFIFKWFDHITLDLICIGAHVCDSKKRLEDYVVDWLLPLLRLKEYHKSLPSLSACSDISRDDISQYLIVEECHIRTCQTIRRFNAAIKKINKRTGDVIIVQMKHDICSPLRMMERVSSELIAQYSALCHPNDRAYASWMLDLWKNYQTGAGIESMVDADFNLKSGFCHYSAKKCLNALLSKNEKLPMRHKFENNPLDQINFNSKKVIGPHEKKLVDVVEQQKDEKKSASDKKNETGLGQGSTASEPCCEPKSSLTGFQETRNVPSRVHAKKKRKSKTSIPANTKSKLKAEVQVEKRREAGRMQKCQSALEPQMGLSQPEELEEAEKNIQPLKDVKDKTVAAACSEVVTLGLIQATGSTCDDEKQQESSLVTQSIGFLHIERITNATQDNEFDKKVETGALEDPSDVSQVPQKVSELTRMSGQNISLSSSSVGKNKLPAEQSHSPSHVDKSVSQSSDEDIKRKNNRVHDKISRMNSLNDRMKKGSLLGNYETSNESEEDPFSVATQAVLSTFPDRFAEVMRENCLFTFRDQMDVFPSPCKKKASGTSWEVPGEGGHAEKISDSLAPACLENLKVFLHPSSTVTSFVENIIEAALDEIQKVPLSLRLASAVGHGGAERDFLTLSLHRGLPPEDTSSESHNYKSHKRNNYGESRISMISLATTYHINRLFNDYLHDDKEHQQKIVCEFRKQVDTLITSPPNMEGKDFSYGKLDTDENYSGLVENETHLFERSLFPRQLAAIELFAAAFTYSDLIGTRKGLHSLTLTLLGKTSAAYMGVTASNGGLLCRSLIKQRPLHWLMGSHEGSSSNFLSSSTSACVMNHSSALCSLCFLFYILGARRVLQLAESQAGRRFFDNIMTRLSDWLRRLSMIAFTEFDTLRSLDTKDESYCQYLRQQYLLRHSYWALVLVLKDIVASRSPVTSTIVSRETEAALTLATLPFLLSDSNCKDSHENQMSPSTEEHQQKTTGHITGKSSEAKENRSTEVATRCSVKTYNVSCRRRKAGWTALGHAFVSSEVDQSGSLYRYSDIGNEKEEYFKRHGAEPKLFSRPSKGLSKSEESIFMDTSESYDKEEEEDEEEEENKDVEDDDEEEDDNDEEDDSGEVEDEDELEDEDYEHDEDEDLDDDLIVSKLQMESDEDEEEEEEEEDGSLKKFVENSSLNRAKHKLTQKTGRLPMSKSTRLRSRKQDGITSLNTTAATPGVAASKNLVWSAPSRLDPAKYPELRQFLDRRTGRPRVSKDKPCIVHESPTWFVTYKPAFWHCSGPSHCVDRPLDLQRLKKGDIEKTLQHISLGDLQYSGKMESFHLWLMKQFPQQETIKRWTELECGLCHRIDLETSGAVLIARTRRTRDFLWDQFRRRNVHKEYLLLCHGRIKERFGVVKTRLLTKDYDSRSRIKSHFTQVVEEGGEDSLTEYHVCRVYRRKPWSSIIQNLSDSPSTVGEYVVSTVVENNGNVSGEEQTSTTGHMTHLDDKSSKSKVPETSKESSSRERWGNRRSQRKGKQWVDGSVGNEKTGGEVCADQVRHKMWIDPTLNGQMTENEEFSLCKCRIVTGRTHQIRVHMRHIGHPLVSDTKYLEPKKCQEDRQWCPRMFLHAAVLEFSDPDSPNTFVEAVCPLAHELLRALDTALICIDDYEPHTMKQYGIPTRPVTSWPNNTESVVDPLEQTKAKGAAGVENAPTECDHDATVSGTQDHLPQNSEPVLLDPKVSLPNNPSSTPSHHKKRDKESFVHSSQGVASSDLLPDPSLLVPSAISQLSEPQDVHAHD